MASYIGDWLWNTFDKSQIVEVRLFTAKTPTERAHWNDETVLVPEDMVVVGGGVIIERRRDPAFITASYPNKDLSGWSASSKDHEIPCPHSLLLFALGMRIEGLKRSELFDRIRIGINNSTVVPHPEAEAAVPAGYVLLSGGVRVEQQGAGSLVTASFPSSRSTWKVRAKDHVTPSPSVVWSYAIGIAHELPVGLVLGARTRSTSVTDSAPRATVEIQDRYALTGGGGEAVFSGAGSLLRELWPDKDAGASMDKKGFTAQSHDHIVPDPARMRAHALGIRIRR